MKLSGIFSKKLAATAAAFVLTALTGGAGAQGTEEESKTFNCGTGCNAALNTETGRLNITGQGNMNNYSQAQGGEVPWYDDASSIKTVNIANNLKSIGSFAFANLPNLTSVTIGSGVTTIGNGAFQNCSDLTTVTIGTGVTSIGNGAFQNCSNLTTVTIPDGVTSIEYRAFYNCYNMTSLTIGSNVASIGMEAFYHTSLTSVKIPNSVTSIGERAFSDCYSLASVTIGDGVTSIGVGAFAETGLTSVTIPSSVTSIGNAAFVGCSDLTTITVYVSSTYYSSDNGVLFNKNKTTLIQYPAGKGSTYTIPNSVKSIGVGAFAMAGLTSVTIPDGVTSIGIAAFANCYNLTAVTIPNSVTSIGEGAFAECGRLESITVDNSSTHYSSDNGVLFNKNKTTLIQYPAGKQGSSYTIPDGVTSVGRWAFAECTSLTSITCLRSTPPAATNDAFYSVSSSACLYVPTASAKAAYQSANGWMDFTCINPITREFTITFSATSADGKLTATVDGKVISSPAQVDSGKTVIFTAAPGSGFGVDGWTRNDTTVNGTNITYTHRVSSPNAVVSVQFGVAKYAVIYDVNGGAVRRDITVVLYDSYSHPESDGWNGAFLRINVNGADIDSLTTHTGGASVLRFAANTGERVDIYWHRGGYDDECAFAVYYTPAAPAAAPKFDPASDAVNDASAFLVYRQYGGLRGVATGTRLGTFVPTGGLASYPLEHNQPASVKLPDGKDLVRGGYMFAGWNTNAAGTGTNYNSGETMTIVSPDANVVMWARWRRETYTVTFAANGGRAITPSTGVTGNDGRLVSALPAPVNTSDPFVGWYTTPNGGTRVTDSYVYSGNTTIYARWESTVSVLSPERVVPRVEPEGEAVAIAPAIVFAGEFTAGPNPVARSAGAVKFYRQGKRVESSTLTVYDASGNVVNRVKITDNALGSQARRKVGSWDLRDGKGRPVSEGAYLVKGVLKMSDGRREKVSLIVGVR